MSWGTDFSTNVFIRGFQGDNVFIVNDKMLEIEKYIKDIDTKLSMFASSNPSCIVPDEWKEQPIDFIYNEVNSLLEQRSEYSHELALFYLYKEYLLDKENAQTES